MRRHLIVPVALLIAFVGAHAGLMMSSVDAAPPPPIGDLKYYDAASCGGADCHSKDAPEAAPPYMQEFTLWSPGNVNENTGKPKDLHSYAYTRLVEDEQSAAWMEKLNELEGTEDDPDLSPRCLTCHSVATIKPGKYGEPQMDKPVALNEGLMTPSFKLEDGVSCDMCHGPAEKWIEPHKEKHWVPDQWKGTYGKDSFKMVNDIGVLYTKDPVIWAKQCVRCHLAIDTNLLDAGHIDTYSFEAFSQSKFQPPHWRDYDAEEAFHGVRLWQTGQAAAFHTSAAQVAIRGLSGQSGDKHNTPSPPRIRQSFVRLWGHWVVFRHALNAADPAEAKKVDAKMVELTKVAWVADDGMDPVAVGKKAEEIANMAKGYTEKMAKAKLDAGIVAGLMKAIANDPDTSWKKDSAEQGAMAMYALWTSNWYQTKPGNFNDVNNAIYGLYSHFNRKQADTYDPEGYKTAMATLQGFFK